MKNTLPDFKNPYKARKQMCLKKAKIKLPKSISFIIPTLNNINGLIMCIDSIKNVCMINASKYIPYEIIVVSDGSNIETAKRLKVLSIEMNFKLIFNNKNLGYTRSINNGIRASSGEIVILTSDDIKFEQKIWMSTMIRALNINPKIGIIGCRLLYPDRKIQFGGYVYTGGINLISHKYLNMPEDTKEACKTVRVLAVTGAVLLIKREVLDSIGLLSENYRILCSDSDYCLTANNYGWMIVYNGRCYAIHAEAQTRNSIINDHSVADLKLFYNKWKNPIETWHHQNII